MLLCADLTKCILLYMYNCIKEVMLIRVIYVDVLFVVNFFITFLLLLLTAKLTKQKEKPLRLTAASALGGAYALIILAPRLPSAVLWLTKAAAALVLVLIAFGFCNLKKYLQSFLMFLFSNFVFLGIIAGGWMLLKPDSVVIKNSTVYFDISARALLIIALAAYLIAVVIIRLHDRRADKKEIYDVTVETHGKRVHLYAFADSGNNLVEPFSAYPVIIAKKSLFPDTETQRVIPYETVGGEGMLTAFKPEKVVVASSGNQIEIENVYIALSDRIKNEDYSAILNPKIIS